MLNSVDYLEPPAISESQLSGKEHERAWDLYFDHSLCNPISTLNSNGIRWAFNAHAQTLSDAVQCQSRHRCSVAVAPVRITYARASNLLYTVSIPNNQYHYINTTIQLHTGSTNSPQTMLTNLSVSWPLDDNAGKTCLGHIRKSSWPQ